MGRSRQTSHVTATRVGLIGDVHTERAQLASALELFAGQRVDRILCTGDVPDGPGDCRDVDACCRLLEAASVITISGNHDRWLLDGEMRDLPDATPSEEVAAETQAFLRALPQLVELDTPAGRALLCHGIGSDDMAMVSPFDHGRALEDNAALQQVLATGRYRFVLNGHSHKAMVRTISGLTVINAGTLLSDHGAGCVLVDFSAREATFYGVDAGGALAEGERKAL